MIGGERTVDEFQAAFNRSVGLGRDHPWFVGAGEEYWRSDVKYQCPLEFEELPSGGSIRPDEEVYNAGETTIDGMVGRLGLAERDRICYLFDYGDEWRFYAILKEVLRDESGDRAPEVVKEKGDPVEQYPPADWEGTAFPEPLESIFPDGPVPVDDLRALEEREDVEHVLALRRTESGESGRVAIRFEDAEYLLEHLDHGWDVAAGIERGEATEEAALGRLVDAVREWHATVADATSVARDSGLDDRGLEAMNAELDRELERRGYGHL